MRYLLTAAPPPARALVCWWLAVLAVLVVGAAQAASAPDDYQSQISHLKEQIQELKSNDGLSEGVRKHALDTYHQAVSALQSAQSDQQQADKLRSEAAKAPDQIDRVRRSLADLGQPKTLAHLGHLSLDQLSSRQSKLQTQLSNAQTRLSDLRDKLKQVAQRPASARQALADARNKLQSLAGGNAVNVGQAASVPTQAQNALTAARRDALSAKIERLQNELSGLDSHQRLLEAKRSLAEAQVARLNESLSRIQTALSRKQQASAQSLQNESEQKLNELRSSLGPITQAAQRNVTLTHDLASLSQHTEQLNKRQTDQRQQVESLKRRLNLVQRQLEIGGSSVALGDVLRHQRRSLASPALSFLTASRAKSGPDISSAELKRFQLQQDRAKLNNPEAMADRLARQAGAKLNPGQHASLIHLLKQRRAILDMLIDAEGRYIDLGRDLSSLSQQYDETLSAFNTLLDERLFWLPSFQPVLEGWPKRVIADLPWILNPHDWRLAISSFLSGIVARPVWTGLGTIVIALLIALRPAMRRRMKKLGKPIGNVSHDTVWLTLRVALITVLLTLPSILMPMLVGYLTQHAPNAPRFSQAVGAAVFGLGALLLFIEPFANVCRAHGLADRHFQWPLGARRRLHRALRVLAAALIVPVLVITITEAFDDDAKRETLGRAAFMLSELSIAVFAWRILHPARGALSFVMSPQAGTRWRLGYLWLPVGMGIALTLAGLAAFGYYYTALQLQTRFFYSAALLGAAIVFYSLIVRWLTVVERRLALARALRKREEAREARAAREAAAVSGDSAPDTLESLEIDLVQISEQTRGLIKVVIALLIGTGLWFIWSDTLPALQLLDNINLWQYASQVDGKTTVSRVTLGALLLAIAVGVVTALAGRNLPGFLEITILRRFSMDSGSRYAMATLFQYAIVIIGLLVAVNLIGLHWSSIQWLIAAVGVGLGFGLQEIFANFVSGIVILFERPVRVGDTVSVGTLTGTVSRIRIRATTVTDWDNKEVIIPNKTFITETVINWTLTDDITRLVLEVRVALDSDSALVEKLIYQAIRAQTIALDNPAPSVFMVGYGESALLFEARVFYHDLYNLLPLQHALYRSIKERFDANGVEIVYPQHDLHIRSIDDQATQRFSSTYRDTRGPARAGRPHPRDAGQADAGEAGDAPDGGLPEG